MSGALKRSSKLRHRLRITGEGMERETMAHMIDGNSFAYVGAAAWHGLGVKVADGATGAEMLKAAGMEWRVQRRAIAMRPSDGSKDRMVTAALDGYRAIVRSDNDFVFQVASSGYEPVQNAEIVDFFREYCEAGHATMETVGALKDGAVVWALARLNGGSTKTLQGVDELRGYMLLATSHDGSVRTTGKPTQVRVVCNNTLTAAFGEKSEHVFSMKHTRKFGAADRENAQKVMGMASAQVARTNDLAAELAAVTIDHDGWMTFIGKLLGEENVIDAKTADLSRVAAAIQDATIESPGSNLVTARGTLWGAVNGVTWYADRTARARSDSNRLFSSWFGPNESLKKSAMNVALEMAGISAR